MDPPALVSRLEDAAPVRGAAGLLHDPAVDGPMPERPMDALETERVRERLRGVSYPGFSRDIVGAGLVGERVTLRVKPSRSSSSRTRATQERSPTWSGTSEKSTQSNNEGVKE